MPLVLGMRLFFSSVPAVSHQVLILRKTGRGQGCFSGVGGTGSSPASQIHGNSSVSAS